MSYDFLLKFWFFCAFLFDTKFSRWILLVYLRGIWSKGASWVLSMEKNQQKKKLKKHSSFSLSFCFCSYFLKGDVQKSWKHDCEFCFSFFLLIEQPNEGCKQNHLGKSFPFSGSLASSLQFPFNLSLRLFLEGNWSKIFKTDSWVSLSRSDLEIILD